MPSAVSGCDTFCSTDETAAEVSMLTGYTKYLCMASPGMSVRLPALPAAVALDSCTKGGICFILLSDIQMFAWL